MSQTTSQQFQRKFGEYQHKAQREPVEITRHGRRELVLMSAERYDWLVAASKRRHAIENLPETIVNAVRSAKMEKRHNHFNKLMQ
ncbi:MAG: type II toxin-antitoxin system prevent-host-death family antitoxin [Alphaproteobacteria bacterium]|nr:type II toxin-antitoxin system prevent-host-death family antitoxin [Alphaproteobacteria bacterium]